MCAGVFAGVPVVHINDGLSIHKRNDSYDKQMTNHIVTGTALHMYKTFITKSQK